MLNVFHLVIQVTGSIKYKITEKVYICTELFK